MGYCPASVRDPKGQRGLTFPTLALAVALAAGLPAPALSETVPATTVQPLDPALEGRPIHSVRLLRPVQGRPGYFEPVEGNLGQLARNQLRTVPGGVYRGAVAVQDQARLNRLGRFGLSELRTSLLPDGSVEVTFVLQEQPIIQDVQVTGNKRIPTADIAREIDLLRGHTIDTYQLDRYARIIENLYQKRGYASVSVTWDPDELAQGIVLYRVIEGERVRVMDIRFQGNAAFSSSELRSKIKTETWTIINKAPLNEEVLEEDISTLIRFYQDRGYLDVEVDRLPPRLSPDGREAIVTFVINEGPVYTFRGIKVFYPDTIREVVTSAAAAEAALRPGEEYLAVGPGQYAVYAARPFSSAQIAGLMELKRGDVYGVLGVNLSMRRIEQAFAALGYVQVREGGERLDRRELRDPDNPQLVDLLLLIRPGEPKLTGEVIVSGNEITRHEVPRRFADLKPDRPLDWTKVQDAERRVQRSRIFATDFQTGRPMSSITIQPEDPDFPGYRDVLIEVAETSTAEFNIGGSVSSDSGLVGRLSYTQRNFDITDFPDSFSEFIAGRSFRGGGQTLSIDLLPGTDVQTYRVSLTEPSLFDSDYSGNGSIAYRVREFDKYDEERASLRLGVSRRFGQRWNGTGMLRLEQIRLENISSDAPTDVFDLEGSNDLAVIGFGLQRSTLNSNLLPSRGVYVNLAIEQAGLLGDFDYTKLRAESQVYLPIFTDTYGRNTVLSLTTEIGYIPQGPDDVPVFERLYRGGSSFRGFQYRTVAPKGIRQDNGERSKESVGGTWEFFQSIQVMQPLFEETLFGVAFVDMGTVTNDPGFDDFRLSVGLGIRLVIPMLSPAPIAFDFGFPLIKQDGDRERIFMFTVDVPF